MPNHQVTERFMTRGVKERFMKRLHRGEKGFTLIELLIAIAIMGIIAAIVVPNGAGLMTSGRLNAAITEAENVKTASAGYVGQYGEWPDSSDDVSLFLEGGSDALKATYQFGGDGSIDSVSDQEWEGIHWDADSQTWARGEEAAPVPPEPAPPVPIHPVPLPPAPIHPVPIHPVPFR
jgi:prepilin-type N-terminal cleavage/methylation domain-containing protein